MAKEKPSLEQRVIRRFVEFAFPFYMITSGVLNTGGALYWYFDSQPIRKQTQVILDNIPSGAGYYERAYYRQQQHIISLIDLFSIVQSFSGTVHAGIGGVGLLKRKRIADAILI